MLHVYRAVLSRDSSLSQKGTPTPILSLTDLVISFYRMCTPTVQTISWHQYLVWGSTTQRFQVIIPVGKWLVVKTASVTWFDIILQTTWPHGELQSDFEQTQSHQIHPLWTSCGKIGFYMHRLIEITTVYCRSTSVKTLLGNYQMKSIYNKISLFSRSVRLLNLTMM